MPACPIRCKHAANHVCPIVTSLTQPNDGIEFSPKLRLKPSRGRPPGGGHYRHYNVHQPHHSFARAPPNRRPLIETWTVTQPIAANRRDRLGGLSHEYERAA